MRIIFMGSPEFAVSSLSLLLKSDTRPLEVIAVYTKAPKPSGRGQKPTKSPVHVIAEENNIEVCTPISLRSSVEQEKFKNFKPDVAVVSAYGLILPREILNTPKYGCINIHPSLLPRWRGAAPIQHTILAGDQETGVSIMQLDEGLDSGPILKQEKFPVKKNDNYEVLHEKLSELGGHLLLNVLNEIEKYVPIEQNDNDACYADKIEDYKIYASDTCEIACRKIKAFYPKAFINVENKRVRILDADFKVNRPLAEPVYDEKFSGKVQTSTAEYLNVFEERRQTSTTKLPSEIELCKRSNTHLASKQGEIVNDNMHISLKGGTLIPKIVQMEGRNPCGIEDFIRGLKSSMAKKFIE